MKRTIEVKEKSLINKLNDRVNAMDRGNVDAPPQDPGQKYWVGIDVASEPDRGVEVRWDNHGPVQFEEEDTKTTIVTQEPETECDVYQPARDPKTGRFVKAKAKEEYVQPLCEAYLNLDNEEERPVASLKKACDKNMDTRLRTPENTLEVDLPFPGEVKTYEEVNHPQHYNNYDVEVIDMMERTFGAYDAYAFCKLNAFKYRMRAGTKPGQSADKDLKKEQWYLNKAEELKRQLETTGEWDMIKDAMIPF